MAGAVGTLGYLGLLLAAAVPPPVESTAVPSSLAAAAAQELQIRLDSGAPPQWLRPEARSAAHWAALRRFYAERGFALLWWEGEAPGPAAQVLLEALQRGREEGVDPERYASALSGPAPASFDGQQPWPTAVADRDLRLSYAFLLAATDLLEGRVSPRGASAYWSARTHAEADPLALLALAAERGAAAALDSLRPEHPQYAALRRAVAAHRAVAAAGGWPPVPSLAGLARGRPDPRVPLLRARLRASGDLPAEAASSRPLLFDRGLEQGLRRFQERHGLPAHGRPDGATVAALNVPVEERIAQIELNLERWRWLPRALRGRHVVVNVPAFELHAYDGPRRALRMKVVTGQAGETPTPIFSAEMTRVVFSPWWNVPPRIAEEKVLPAVQGSRGYLRRKNMEVVRTGSTVLFRQRPGPDNPMGLVKFLLPNPFHVYLHDTPKGHLFARARRDFSHGCVRLERPRLFARWVLAGDPPAAVAEEWTEQRIRAAMKAGRERTVELGAPVTVHVGYFTAWVDEGGATRFLPDVYDHDAAQRRLLDGEGPWRKLALTGGRPSA